MKVVPTGFGGQVDPLGNGFVDNIRPMFGVPLANHGPLRWRLFHDLADACYSVA